MSYYWLHVASIQNNKIIKYDDTNIIGRIIKVDEQNYPHVYCCSTSCKYEKKDNSIVVVDDNIWGTISTLKLKFNYHYTYDDSNNTWLLWMTINNMECIFKLREDKDIFLLTEPIDSNNTSLIKFYPMCYNECCQHKYKEKVFILDKKLTNEQLHIIHDKLGKDENSLSYITDLLEYYNCCFCFEIIDKYNDSDILVDENNKIINILKNCLD